MFVLQYKSSDMEQSILKGVPMQYLDEIRRLFAIDGIKIKIRYRGPRSHRYPKGARRWESGPNYSVINAHSNCLKADATSFAVYRR